MNKSVRAPSDADGVVNEMRLLVQTAEPPADSANRDQLERTVSTRVATILMVLLVLIIFAMSALPDVGPSLAKVVEAHL